MKKLIPSIFLSLACCQLVNAQETESLLKGIEDSIPPNEKVTGAFKSTRVINAHSLEMLGKGHLDFRILHRFGRVNQGIKQFFGLDAATMRMSFDYGITDNVMVGIGRSTLRKEYDAFIKARILQQSKGSKSVPLSLLIAAGSTVWTEESFEPVKPDFNDRSAYYVQLIAGRKFSQRLSFQLSPLFLHRNMVETPEEEKSIFVLGGGARYKVSKRIAITADYHHALDGVPDDNTDPLSIGVDIETGGHVFQLHFSNTSGMNERAYITQTNEKFFNGDIRFGFNLSRIFKIRK
ncbi:MAG: hypothetical protein H7Y03_13365 [Chitinophagaceae bacterium]|nr:hypothetical protein [Chitinophagaceae bacterium]